MKRKRSLDPQNISDNVWYFEDPNGLAVYVEQHDETGMYLRTSTFLIPTSMLRKSLSRLPKR